MKTQTLDAEESAVVAIYPSRHLASISQEFLQDNGIETIISADDAGGMHPQLQYTQGVKLLALSSLAYKAHNLLEEAGLLPEKMVEGKEDLKPENIRSLWVILAMFIMISLVVLLLLRKALA